LGLGDIEPEGNFWDILTAILSFTGLILISIAITYLIPVSAEITKRKISVYINTLGGSVEEILLNHWNGKDFKELEQPFISLIDSIILHAQNHKAYSVLFFFIPQTRKKPLSSISPTSMRRYCSAPQYSFRATPSLQCTYQIEKSYIQLPGNATGHFYNSWKKNASYINLRPLKIRIKNNIW
jgi:hypothetical protein